MYEFYLCKLSYVTAAVLQCSLFLRTVKSLQKFLIAHPINFHSAFCTYIDMYYLFALANLRTILHKLKWNLVPFIIDSITSEKINFQNKYKLNIKLQWETIYYEN